MKAEYVDHMGNDMSVVNAARVSFDKVSDWLPSGALNDYEGVIYQIIDGRYVNLPISDHKLIKFLSKHNHWTPFAHTAITLRMKAPVPIRTQCFKHKAGFVENEESRRYISGTPEVYVPEFFRSKPEGSIKQGSGDVHPNSPLYVREYAFTTGTAIAQYERMIADGVCPEQARFILPQGAMVNWMWTGNLAAFARFYNQRTDPHAQVEIQDLAKAVGEIIEPLFPVSWKALTT